MRSGLVSEYFADGQIKNFDTDEEGDNPLWFVAFAAEIEFAGHGKVPSTDLKVYPVDADSPLALSSSRTSLQFSFRCFKRGASAM